MWHTSYCLLQKGIEDQKGCSHQFRASLVFTAFTLEAYLNHIGPKMFNCWNDLERLRPREKLNIIAERLQVDINYGDRPWQIIKILFGFRNKIAHGKSNNITKPGCIPFNDFSEDLFGELALTEWEKYCNRENAEQARADVEKIVKTLYEKGRFEDDYPFTFGSQSGEAKLIEQ
jgi:hypothetical protein